MKGFFEQAQQMAAQAQENATPFLQQAQAKASEALQGNKERNYSAPAAAPPPTSTGPPKQSVMGTARNTLEQPLVSSSAPAQQGMEGQKFWPGDTSDPFKVLDQIDSVSIQEQIKGMEVLTGFETGNSYIIRDHKTGADVFLAVEIKGGLVGAFQRNALGGGGRGFTVKLGMLKGANTAPERFAVLERPFQCTCCCLNRPVTTIKDSKTGASLGGITEPCAPCQIKLQQFDATGAPSGTLSACCTKLCCFGCPCGCTEVSFPIFSPGGALWATIKKQFTSANAIGAFTGLNIDADHFSVHFQPGMTPQEKLQAIGTTIFMDFCYFTKGGAESQKGSAATKVGGFLGGQEGAALGMLAGFVAGAVTATVQEQQKPFEW